MAGTKRGLRPSRAAERRGDEPSLATPATGARTAKSIPETIGSGSAPGDEEIEEVETEYNTLLSTPQSGGASTTPFRTADFSRPVTRSTKKGYFDSILVESAATPSRAHDRLRVAITGNGLAPAANSRLEEAEDIQYSLTERSIEDNDREDLDTVEDQNPQMEFHNELENQLEKSHPTVGGLRVPRRSDRLRAKNRAAREPSPSTALLIVPTSNSRVQKRRKRASTNTSLVRVPLRRSARLAKPLEVFHKYPELPPELRLMIWEAAVQPRLTYICNRLSMLEHAHDFGIQNKVPTWFMTCQMSVFVASRYYKKLFGLSHLHQPLSMALQPVALYPLRAQDINPDVDIVVYEPCHSGCRACYCAQQYRREDRSAVQKLAVQIDSPHLPLSSEPGWITVSRSWPNLTTLYMMKPAIKGPDRSEKAMIRIKEGDHEMALRKLFEAWKKGAGKDHSLTTLEFVRVVEQEADTKDIKERYQSVEDRKTGLVEDIVLG